MEKVRREDAGLPKGRKVAIHCAVPMIWGSGGLKSNLAKAAGAEPAGQRRDEKLHAVVAGSTFPSQNVQNTPTSDHFWKLRCRKSARCCGAKHISKSKCTKYTNIGPLLEVEMSKKCTPLWRKAHFQKTEGFAPFWTLRCRPQQQQQQQQLLLLLLLPLLLLHLLQLQLQLQLQLHHNYSYATTTSHYTTLNDTTLTTTTTTTATTLLYTTLL